MVICFLKIIYLPLNFRKKKKTLHKQNLKTLSKKGTFQHFIWLLQKNLTNQN